jgi:hypothetical protein
MNAMDAGERYLLLRLSGFREYVRGKDSIKSLGRIAVRDAMKTRPTMTLK